jgi:hypothetical protein
MQILVSSNKFVANYEEKLLLVGVFEHVIFSSTPRHTKELETTLDIA